MRHLAALYSSSLLLPRKECEGGREGNCCNEKGGEGEKREGEVG